MTLTYTVPGRPTTWARKRLDTRKRKPLTFTSDEQKLAMVAHQLHALVALGPHRATWGLDGAFAIGVLGYWPDAAVGDVDRLVSLAMDALEGIAYRKDRQVRELLRCAVISDGSPERVEVTVVRLERDTVEPKRRAKRAAPGAVKPRSAKRAASALTSAGQQVKRHGPAFLESLAAESEGE